MSESRRILVTVPDDSFLPVLEVSMAGAQLLPRAVGDERVDAPHLRKDALGSATEDDVLRFDPRGRGVTRHEDAVAVRALADGGRPEVRLEGEGEGLEVEPAADGVDRAQLGDLGHHLVIPHGSWRDIRLDDPGKRVDEGGGIGRIFGARAVVKAGTRFDRVGDDLRNVGGVFVENL